MSNVGDSQQGIFFQLLWLLVVIASIICAGICLKENVDGITQKLFAFLVVHVEGMALFTRDILTHNIAIKRYCNKKYF